MIRANPSRPSLVLALRLFLSWLAVASLGTVFGQQRTSELKPVPIQILEIEGRVEVSRAGAVGWDPAYTNQVLETGDRIRCRERSRAVLRWSDASIVRLDELSEVVVLPPPDPRKESGFNLFRGVLYFFHRGDPASVRFRTPSSSAAVRGTEFALEAAADGTTVLTLIDGEVEFGNDTSSLIVHSGEQARVSAGQAPTKTALLAPALTDAIQWCLYYPAVLSLEDLTLTPDERRALADSLEAYRAGDLLQAVARYPAGRLPSSVAERAYLAAVLLAVGRVDQTQRLLDEILADPAAGVAGNAAQALRRQIMLVKGLAVESHRPPQIASEWMAESYLRQSLGDLDGALQAARQAVAESPNFGFGWVRVAELEFSFGRVADALDALDTGLRLSPRNAEGLALKGFLLGAQNRIPEAIRYFDQALGIDGALGNAWLGRGLCQIRRGHGSEGRADLLAAAAVEPQRALLRSYLGKAYADSGDRKRAVAELRLAENLDPKDPTAWLYSALLNLGYNQPNQAVKDLERSQELNESRRIYRSRLLLDQDRAVRGVNLATVYADLGMGEVSLREAVRAVNGDYANFSAHLLLANSYDQLRDPRDVTLRFETAYQSEYLIANLLSPVGGGVLSPAISQQEYSRLFERDRLGVASTTEYLSRGDWNQYGAQYGILGDVSYAVEAQYHSGPGQARNQDFTQRGLAGSVKLQLTPQDNLFVQVFHYDADGGDLAQYYEPTNANSSRRFRERQEPDVLVGFHHEWSPQSHTLFLAGRFDDTLDVKGAQEPALIKSVDVGEISAVRPIFMRKAVYRDTQEIYSLELQQIWQQSAWSTTIFGARRQWGRFQLRNLQMIPSELAGIFPDPPEPPADQRFGADFARTSAYGYERWQPLDSLALIGGLTLDWVTFPQNFRSPPLSSAEDHASQVSPKGGVIWTPARGTTVRAAYTRSLTGASLDQSIQLEPTEVAGFNQAYRSVMPESLVGATAGARIETYGLSVEQNLPTGTYLGLAGEVLNSRVRRVDGAFELNLDVSDFAFPSGLREHLDFQERSVVATLNQLIGREWSVGARYRLTDADLRSHFVDVPATAVTYPPFSRKQNLEALLHEVNFFGIYNHPSGFFAQGEAVWFAQSNQGYAGRLPGDDFWQIHFFAGYRFPRRRAEVRLGVLNVTDQNYRLNPLTLYSDMPRERTFTARLMFNF